LEKANVGLRVSSPSSIKFKFYDVNVTFLEQSSPAHLVFFLLPIGFQISINIVLFVLTAVHCNRIKAEIHRMQMNDSNEQQKKKSFIADKAT
jgi:hypothetical protein